MSSALRQVETPLTPEDLVDLPTPNHVRVSPSGDRVVYATKPAGRKGEHELSTLWVAETGREKSARQITAGTANDRDPEWSPDGSSIAFLSDRGGAAGKACALYVLALSGFGGEAYALTDTSHEASISAFAWSSNGCFIAFASADEKSEERKAKDEKKDDVAVYGAEWPYARLRVLHIATREVSTIWKQEAHVRTFAWSLDSRRLAVVSTQTPEIDSAEYHGSLVDIVDICGNTTTKLFEYPGAVRSGFVWQNDRLLFGAGVDPHHISTSQAVYSASFDDGKYEIISHGRDDSLAEIRPCSSIEATVNVLVDLENEISVIGGEVLYRTEQDVVSYDVVRAKHGSLILVFITSTVATPPEVYVKAIGSKDILQLSDHGASLKGHLSVVYKIVRCRSFDDTVDLDAYWAAPAIDSGSTDGSLPAMIYIHGGPYGRVTQSFDGSYHQWTPYLLCQKRYGILCPNYRGSSGRGHTFAATAVGAMGTVEYADVLALVEAAIAQGLIDKHRLVVGGWSQGGFLSYLSAVRNGMGKLPNDAERTWRYKGAICGAGVTDWDMMSMTSDAAAFESELAGGAPWTTTHESDVSARRGSPIWEFALAAKKQSVPRVLILHGEEDERVPLTQAVAFRRGCLEFGVGFEMAVYPREPHIIQERTHRIDMLKRVLKFIDMQLAG